MKTKILLVVLLLLLGIQLVPADRSNPADHAPPNVPPELSAILERACFDCHSNRTRWPWYSRIAPVSWLVSRDVREGREHLNFSRWGTLTAREQAHLREEIAEEVAEGEMPPWFYTPLHPGAKLSDSDREVLFAWCGTRGEDGHEEDEEAHQEAHAGRH